MCGIAGLFDRAPIPPEHVRLMTDPIAHRGPDDAGSWQSADGRVVFGHRRLAIIDLSPAGHQPMASADGRFTIVLNGEIYNHRAIRDELAASGAAPAWRGTSDTETLVAAISAWGLRAALERSVGMFALGLWDGHARTLSLARDRFGEKPLYYGRVGCGVGFGSELKTLAGLPAFDATIDRVALTAMLARGYVPAPRSIYRTIAKLMPGHILTIDEAALRADRLPASEPYWRYTDVVAAGLADPIDDPVAARAGLREVLSRAVADQAVADVPVGAFLSGGIDSSTIVALLQSVTIRPVETFTIGFREGGYDEAVYARQVARHLGTNHHEHYVGAADALAVVPDLPFSYDEPFADASQIPTMLVSRFARRHVTVVLSGDAGDELFGGYNRYVQLGRAWGWMGRLPTAARFVAGSMLGAVPAGAWNGLARLAAGGRARPATFGHKVRRSLGLMRDARDRDGLLDAFLDQWSQRGSPVRGAERLPPLASPVDWPDAVALMAADAVSYLPDDILCKVDRAAMAVGLEGRVPFLDHRVAAYAARIPLALKIRGGTGKAILRDLLYDMVPAQLFERPKAGFGVPVGDWLRGPLRDWAETLLAPDRLAADGLLEPDPIRARWHAHMSGREDAAEALWSVLMFQAWRERWPAA